MEKLGLATNLIKTPKERIVVKVQLTKVYIEYKKLIRKG